MSKKFLMAAAGMVFVGAFCTDVCGASRHSSTTQSDRLKKLGMDSSARHVRRALVLAYCGYMASYLEGYKAGTRNTGMGETNDIKKLKKFLTANFDRDDNLLAKAMDSLEKVAVWHCRNHSSKKDQAEEDVKMELKKIREPLAEVVNRVSQNTLSSSRGLDSSVRV